MCLFTFMSVIPIIMLAKHFKVLNISTIQSKSIQAELKLGTFKESLWTKGPNSLSLVGALYCGETSLKLLRG